MCYNLWQCVFYNIFPFNDIFINDFFPGTLPIFMTTIFWNFLQKFKFDFFTFQILSQEVPKLQKYNLAHMKTPNVIFRMMYGTCLYLNYNLVKYCDTFYEFFCTSLQYMGSVEKTLTPPSFEPGDSRGIKPMFIWNINRADAASMAIIIIIIKHNEGYFSFKGPQQTPTDHQRVTYCSKQASINLQVMDGMLQLYLQSSNPADKLKHKSDQIMSELIKKLF